jgi:hypothetical protein
MDLAFDTHFVSVIMKTINAGENGLMLRAKSRLIAPLHISKKGLACEKLAIHSAPTAKLKWTYKGIKQQF